MRKISIIHVLILAASTSCVPLQRYNEQEQTLQYYKAESLTADSLRSANQLLVTENAQTEAELSENMRQLERLTATNVSLNKSYQEMVTRYNQLVTQNQETLNSSSSENLSLQNQLAERQSEIENKERMLSQLEIQLRAREQELQRIEGGAKSGANAGADGLVARTPASYSADEQTRLNKIETRIAGLETRRFALMADLERAMYGFTSNEIGFMERNGDIVVILYQDLLANYSGQSSDIRWRDALQRLADIIQRYTDFNVAIEGHAYAEGNADRSLELSVTRSVNVVKTLNSFGVTPSRLAASGRGQNLPLLPNDSPQNVARNQRTEVIFIPNWQDFYRLLKEQE